MGHHRSKTVKRIGHQGLTVDTIELWNGSNKALVSRDGAWLTNLSDDNGDVLFPKRLLTAPDGSKKARGGCHVCLPNFGPGGDSGLPQHGFGRTTVWEVSSQTSNTVELALENGPDGYETMASKLLYELGDQTISITLTLTNNGKTDLGVGPAFHPYFALQSSEDHVKLNEVMTDLDDLAGTLFETGETQTIRTSRRTIQLQSQGLSTWAQWTDRLGNYVCVEPTLGGYTFLDAKPAPNELLKTGKTQTYSFVVSW